MDYKESVSVKTKEGYKLILKSKNRFDKEISTQYSPSIYELYDGDHLLQSEYMDFQIHLYEYGEMEKLLKGAGFTNIKTYSNFEKDQNVSNEHEMFLFECCK